MNKVVIALIGMCLSTSVMADDATLQDKIHKVCVSSIAAGSFLGMSNYLNPPKGTSAEKEEQNQKALGDTIEKITKDVSTKLNIQPNSRDDQKVSEIVSYAVVEGYSLGYSLDMIAPIFDRMKKNSEIHCDSDLGQALSN